MLGDRWCPNSFPRGLGVTWVDLVLPADWGVSAADGWGVFAAEGWGVSAAAGWGVFAAEVCTLSPAAGPGEDSNGAFC